MPPTPQLAFDAAWPPDSPVAEAVGHNKAEIDGLAQLCIRINCALGPSTRELFALYALLPPQPKPGRVRRPSVDELSCTLRDIDASLHDKCFAPQNEAALASTLDYLAQNPVSFLHPYDERYPQRLQEIPDRPLALFVRGNGKLLGQLQVAIIGSRRATPPALRFASKLARELSAAGIIVTSGLARGCDLAAHLGACRSDGSADADEKDTARTVAVLAHGIDSIYPSEHRRIAQRIVDHGGCLVSERNPGEPPLPRHFPQRNRIIAGISVAAIVVEASLRSGSLVSARLANEYGREVFAVPGSPSNPQAQGCHQLIKNGSHLLEGLDDLAAALGERWPIFARAAGQPPGQAQGHKHARAGARRLSAHQQRCLEQIGAEGMDVGEFALACCLNVVQAQAVLLDLELQGLVRQALTGKFFRMV